MRRDLLAALASGRSRPPPLVLDFRSSAATVGTTAPAGCGYTRAACVSTVQYGTSALFDLTAFSATANLIVRGRASDSWEYGVQLEEARTNRVQRASEFGHATWATVGAYTLVSDRTLADPASGTGASRLTVAAGSNARYHEVTSLAGGSLQTGSVWMKPQVAGSDVSLAVAGASVVTDVQLAAPATWRRYAATVGAHGAGVFDVQPIDARAYTGITAGARDWLLFGAQSEAGAYPTSLVPTTGSTATRAANFLPVLGATWASRILAGRVGLELWLRPMGARSEYSGTRYLWWIDANNHVAFNASTGVLTVTIAGASNTTSAITWSRYADVKVYVELGGSLATYVAVLIDGVRTVPTITGSALGTLAAGDLYLRSSSTTGSTCSWLYMQTFWTPGTRPSWAW